MNKPKPQVVHMHKVFFINEATYSIKIKIRVLITYDNSHNCIKISNLANESRT